MLTTKLLSITNLGAEWVLWLLLSLSVLSVGVMLDRALFFARRRLRDPDGVIGLLAAGDFTGATARVAGQSGMEADVVRIVAEHAGKGAAAMSKMVDAQVLRSRLTYESRLSFLGTLGNNAPFVGLFGTVLGVIQAFAALAANPGAGGAGSVMAGISEALVATAVGLFVALPAVVMYNVYQRWLRRVSQRAGILVRAAEAYLLGRTQAGEGGHNHDRQ